MASLCQNIKLSLLFWFFKCAFCFDFVSGCQLTSAEKYCLSFLLSDLSKNKKFSICSKQVRRVRLTWEVHALHALALTCSRPALQRHACAILLGNTRGQCAEIRSWELWLQEVLQLLFPMTLLLTVTYSHRPRMFTLSPGAARGCRVLAGLHATLHREQRDLCVSSTLMQTSNSGCEPKQDCELHLISLAWRATWLLCMLWCLCNISISALDIALDIQ